MDMQARCQFSFPEVTTGQRTATVDIYKKVGSCGPALKKGSNEGLLEAFSRFGFGVAFFVVLFCRFDLFVLQYLFFKLMM